MKYLLLSGLLLLTFTQAQAGSKELVDKFVPSKLEFLKKDQLTKNDIVKHMGPFADKINDQFIYRIKGFKYGLRVQYVNDQVSYWHLRNIDDEHRVSSHQDKFDEFHRDEHKIQDHQDGEFFFYTSHDGYEVVTFLDEYERVFSFGRYMKQEYDEQESDEDPQQSI